MSTTLYFGFNAQVTFDASHRVNYDSCHTLLLRAGSEQRSMCAIWFLMLHRVAHVDLLQFLHFAGRRPHPISDCACNSVDDGGSCDGGRDADATAT